MFLGKTRPEMLDMLDSRAMAADFNILDSRPTISYQIVEGGM